MDQFHYGIDLRANFESVHAVLEGEVIALGFKPVLGRFVKIKTHGFVLTYGHLFVILASLGRQVRAGELIAISGASGRVTGPHLHFGVNYFGKPINPLRFLSELMNLGNLKF